MLHPVISSVRCAGALVWAASGRVDGLSVVSGVAGFVPLTDSRLQVEKPCRGLHHRLCIVSVRQWDVGLAPPSATRRSRVGGVHRLACCCCCSRGLPNGFTGT